jgi:hypothetical protein
MMKKAPCKNCADRELGCHSTCPLYLDFLEYQKERKAIIAENRRADNEFVHCRRYSRQRAASAAVEQAGKIKRYMKH